MTLSQTLAAMIFTIIICIGIVVYAITNNDFEDEEGI